MFITFEGIDGSGKTTQSVELAARLNGNGIPTLWTNEPGGTEMGRKIREIVINDNDLDPLAEYLLFAADRVQHVKKIVEWMEQGYVVVCDRYIGSSLAYQGMKGVSQDLMLSIFYDTAILLPDATFWVDTDVGTARQRIADRSHLTGDLTVYDKLSHERFHQLYQHHVSLAASFDWLRIDGNQDTEKVTEEVWDTLRGNFLNLNVWEEN